MSAVTITTPPGLLCLLGVRQIIVEEEMDHPLIGGPVLDELSVVADQHLDSVWDKFHLHEFSHIGEQLLEIGKQPSGALSKLLLKPADIPESIEDLLNVMLLAKEKKLQKPGQIKSIVLDKDQYVVQRIKDDDKDHVVLQPDIKFASLKEQSLFYGESHDDDPIDYHDVEGGKGSPEELTAAFEGLVTSAEKADMSRDGEQSLRQLVTECKDVLKAQAGRRSSCECEAPSNQATRAEPVRISARKYASPQLKFMCDKMREREELDLVYMNTGAEWASLLLILLKPGPDQYRMTVHLRVPNESI
jgi:hypothetical protein